MFLRKLQIERIDAAGVAHPCPIAQLDNFAMRNFTNDAIFDDTLPVADGLLEAGTRVPTDRLTAALEDWFRRKSYLAPGETIRITELPRARGAEAGGEARPELGAETTGCI
ncbi:MAG TPA: hypothetical protein VGU46_09565 [Acidobacteriaceae bacterium]|nr:hypothetical protein [Acidobacteriaceae bacterium]